MATLAEALAAIATKTEGAPLSATRMDSDYRVDLQRIAAGTLYYQLRGFPIGIPVRSGTRTIMAVELLLIYRLPGAERTWTEGALQTHLQTLIDKQWWIDMAEVAEVGDVGSVEVARDGDAITAALAISIEVEA